MSDYEPTEELAPDDVYEIGGLRLNSEQIEPFGRFVQWANENPDNWNQLREWEEGKLTFTPVEEPEPTFAPVFEQPYEPSYEVPTEDTEDVDLWSEDYLRGLKSQIEQTQAELERRNYSEAGSAIDDGINTFMSQHGDLTEDDVEQILGYVADRGLVTSIDPDLPYSHKAYEVARRIEEGYRVINYERAMAEGRNQVVEDLATRRRASSSPSSVSSPRTPPAPRNSEERHQAYVDEIRSALNEQA